MIDIIEEPPCQDPPMEMRNGVWIVPPKEYTPQEQRERERQRKAAQKQRGHLRAEMGQTIRRYLYNHPFSRYSGQYSLFSPDIFDGTGRYIDMALALKPALPLIPSSYHDYESGIRQTYLLKPQAR